MFLQWSYLYNALAILFPLDWTCQQCLDVIRDSHLYSGADSKLNVSAIPTLCHLSKKRWSLSNYSLGSIDWENEYNMQFEVIHASIFLRKNLLNMLSQTLTVNTCATNQNVRLPKFFDIVKHFLEALAKVSFQA